MFTRPGIQFFSSWDTTGCWLGQGMIADISLMFHQKKRNNHKLSIIGSNINSIPWIDVYIIIYIYHNIDNVFFWNECYSWICCCDVTSGTWHWVSIRVNRKLIQPYQNNSAVLRKQNHCGHILENICFRKSIASDFDIFSQVILRLSQVCGLYSDSWHQNTSLQFYSTWVQKIALLQNTPTPFAIPMFMIWKPKKKSTNWDTSYGLMAISSVKIVFDDWDSPLAPLGRNPRKPRNPNTSCESKESSCAMRMRSAVTWHRINFWMIIVMILIKYYDDYYYIIYKS